MHKNLYFRNNFSYMFRPRRAILRDIYIYIYICVCVCVCARAQLLAINSIPYPEVQTCTLQLKQLENPN
jgi:hypothetical protein